MHLNFYFLKQLSIELGKAIKDFVVGEVFSQTKDELIIGLYKEQQEFYIRATLDSKFTLLSFPQEFARARRNSIDLFREIIGKKITGVRQYQNERSFALELEDQFLLFFKMHGNRSNIILFEDSQVISVFKHQLSNDLEIQIDSADRIIDQTVEHFEKNGLKKTFPTFDKHISQELMNRGFEDQLSPDQFHTVLALIEEFQPPYFIYEGENGRPYLSLFATHLKELDSTDSCIEGCNQLYYHFTKTYFFDEEKRKLLSGINQKILKASSYVKKSEHKLSDLIHKSRNEELANILMANVHVGLDPKSTTISLFDFYNNQDISIKVNPSLTIQKNAERYYRKAKNQKIEIDSLQSNIDRKKQEVEALEAQIEELENIPSFKELRRFTKHYNKEKDNQERVKDLPFKTFHNEGWEIRVGKNAKSNDELTLRYTNKDDLWLHAKDVSGSHVVIKQIPGKKIPNPVLEAAASLAAYYSKRKNDNLCPVLYTHKKYVRKAKGLAPGQVLVDREDVIMVKPASPDMI